MRLPRLTVNWHDVEGNVAIPEEWRDLDALTRADILKDWLHVLTAEYNDAVANLFPETASHETH